MSQYCDILRHELVKEVGLQTAGNRIGGSGVPKSFCASKEKGRMSPPSKKYIYSGDQKRKKNTLGCGKKIVSGRCVGALNSLYK